MREWRQSVSSARECHLQDDWCKFKRHVWKNSGYDWRRQLLSIAYSRENCNFRQNIVFLRERYRASRREFKIIQSRKSVCTIRDNMRWALTISFNSAEPYDGTKKKHQSYVSSASCDYLLYNFALSKLNWCWSHKPYPGKKRAHIFRGWHKQIDSMQRDHARW